MKNFAITGVAGYIAPRHLQAIKDTGNNLIAALDPNDSVGIMDRFFPECSFFTEFERFDRHLEMIRREDPSHKVDFLTVCSPNFLHDAHIRLALRLHANAICEKPLVMNPWNLDALQALEEETGSRVYTVLQLRVHPVLLKLREKLLKSRNGKKHDVVLTYITSRGTWYHYSWKGQVNKSGGIATNIGVHLFDLLIWFFGKPLNKQVYLSSNSKMAGFIELEHANVKWMLSIDSNDLPVSESRDGKKTYRSILVDGEEVEFTDGFTDLHTRVYEETLAGKGFGIEDARASIGLVYDLRNAKVAEKKEKELLHPIISAGV